MESTKESAPRKKRSFLAKAGRVFLWIIASLIFLIVLILILIQTAPVQNFARKKIVTYLEHKLKTKVEIGKLDIKFPTALSLQNVFFEDQSRDTLLYGGEVRVDISMFRLLKNDINIREIYLDNIVAKIKKLPPDSVFNFQFIIDAFAGEQNKVSEQQDTSTLKMNIDRILVKNTHIIYKDAFTGNDMDLAIGNLDTKISTFDPTHLLFEIPSIKLKGLRGYFYQLEPLQKSVEKTVAAESSQPGNVLQFINKEMDFSDIDVKYKSEPANLNTAFTLSNLVIHPEKFDLKNGVYALNDLTLDKSDIAVEIDTKKSIQSPKDTAMAPGEAVPFKFLAAEIKINNSDIKYDDIAAPRTSGGMDFSHMNISDLSLDAGDIEYTTDTTRALVKSASLKEQSGFVLSNFTTNFLMNPTGISVQDLLIQTPGTEIKKSAVITYPSLESIQKDPSLMGLDIDLQNSKIAVKDIKILAPQMSAQLSTLPADANLYVDTRITGRINDLDVQKLILKGLSSTDINVSGTIKGLPDAKKVYTDLTINKFQTTSGDILSMVPKGTIPANITLPGSIAASGSVKGGMNNLATNLTVNTSLGQAKINGILVNITDSNNAIYNLALNANNLQLGKLIQNPQLGSLTGDFKVEGRGYSPQTAKATFTGTIPVITLNNYTYTNIKTDGSIANKMYKINAAIHDPNLDAVIAANGEFQGKYPGIHLDATIDSIKTQPLHFTPQPVFYHGRINGDFTSLDPDNLSGTLDVTHSILVNNGQRITIDSLGLVAENQGNNHRLTVKSDFLSATIKGNYTLTQLGDVFQQSINPYFSITETKNAVKLDPYDFYITGGVTDNAALRAFLPDLKRLSPVNLSAHFANDSGWSADLTAPSIVYGTFVIDKLTMNIETHDSALGYNISLNQFKSGGGLAVYATTLDGTLKNNNLDFTLAIKDAKSVKKYVVSGLLSQPAVNNYSFSLKPDSLLLNYEKWTVNNDNSIHYFNNDISANNFVLSQANQQLSINSTGTGNNKPLNIEFKNFGIATLTGFIQNDSLLVNGLLNGNAVIRNIQTQPTFITDLTVTNLSVYKDTLGNLTAKVNNTVANQYNAYVTLNGFGNDVTIAGNYFVKPANNSSYDFTVNIVQLQMKALEGFTNGGITNSRGNLYGKIALNGTLDNRNIDGKINFNNIAFIATAVNNLYKVDKESVAIINNKGIELNKFSITDTANNALTINGAINSTDFINYSFNLKVRADNFQAINSTSKDNKLFYGKMIFSTRLNITGTPEHPVIDGDLTINNKTDFTVVLPQEEPGVEKREGVVRFVDYSATQEDSLFMKPYDSLNVSPLLGYDVSVNINVNKEATFNLIVDAANGDFLKLRGTAELTAGIDASGKITLVGSYEIDEGSYDLSFNLIKRKFLIQKGSRIVWTGEPTTAQVSVTAIYIAKTAPLDLVQGQIEESNQTIYKQKLPFEVHLSLAGELLKPQITFDVVLPEEKNYNVDNSIITTVQNKLIQMRQDPGEMNKQVFALLLLNRFVGENPFDNSSGGSLDANTFAKQSVSRLLTEQLNSLTEGLIEGVDINFDLATTEDYTTGTKQDRTDFNVGISKSLLSDRLTVTVGSDFQLEGPKANNSQQNNIAGNISINYKLSKDGKYVLRAYRKNDNTGTIEGYVIETGIGFIISVDYNRFRELFTSKEQRRKKREIRRQNKAESENVSAVKKKEETSMPPTAANEKDNGN